MSLKKVARRIADSIGSSGRKRAAMPRRSDTTNTFRKDWLSLSASGRYDMDRLKAVMLLLIANEAPLPAEWLDHELRGKRWAGHRECHVGGDFLLIYRASNDAIVFVRAGTHAGLFA